MKPKVYLETTVLSYRDIVVAGHQQVTREWWKSCADRFEVVASELVADEAGDGDPQAAIERLEVLNNVPLIETTEEVVELARLLIAGAAMPPKAAADAMHLAVAAINGVDYLVTWNCRHLANATMRERIEEICREAGYQPPIICTPEELLETDSDD